MARNAVGGQAEADAGDMCLQGLPMRGIGPSTGTSPQRITGREGAWWPSGRGRHVAAAGWWWLTGCSSSHSPQPWWNLAHGDSLGQEGVGVLGVEVMLE